MTPAARRVLRASLLLSALVVGVAGLVFSRGSVPRGDAAEKISPAPEPRRLTAAQGEVFAFFNNGRATLGSGRGLFETDFFKPAPAKPVPKAVPLPPPPPPPPRKLAVVYRGFAAFPGGVSVAYVAVDGRVLTLAAGEAMAGGWMLLEFDAERAVLAKGEERFPLPFNRATVVAAPAKP